MSSKVKKVENADKLEGLEEKSKEVVNLMVEKQKIVNEAFGNGVANETQNLFHQVNSIILTLEDKINNCDGAGYEMGTTLYNAFRKFILRLQVDLEAAGIKEKFMKGDEEIPY